MKRMSEVFELPISDVDGFCSPMEFTEQELHAVHAVNHVDALADALSALAWAAEGGTHSELVRALCNADSALAAYRGDK